MSAPAFIADAMLGRLAKWMRLAGFDTIYDPSLDDPEMADMARRTGRILLTRDTELVQRRNTPALLVESQKLDEQLQQVIESLDLSLTSPWGRPRCAVCNSPLEAVDRQEVRVMVPAYVWDRYQLFHRCQGCGRVYWRGTHWQTIEDLLHHVSGTCSGQANSLE